MNYVKHDGSNNLVQYPYTLQNLREDNPNTIFTTVLSEDTLSTYNLAIPVLDTKPSTNWDQYLTLNQPQYTNNQWLITYQVNTYSSDIQWELIKQKRWELVNQPITVDTRTYDADIAGYTVNRMDSAASIERAIANWSNLPKNGDGTYTWTLYDNSLYDISLSELQVVHDAIVLRYDTVFKQAVVYRVTPPTQEQWDAWV